MKKKNMQILKAQNTKLQINKKMLVELCQFVYII